jgi:hypothetical protein
VTFGDSCEAISEALFPMRHHLEHEIEYLRTQLAQERRRVDILIEKSGQPKVVERIPKTIVPRGTPKGWDATRFDERTKEVPARPDAGGQGEADEPGTLH